MIEHQPWPPKKAVRTSRARLPSGKANPVDVYVGTRIRLRRILSGVSQQQLSKAVGVTFQQIQKYEHGMNRVGASRLWDLSLVLKCPVAFFFDGMGQPPANANSAPTNADTLDVSMHENAAMSNRETMMLVRAFYTIKKSAVRQQVLGLANALNSVKTTGTQPLEAAAPALTLGRSGCIAEEIMKVQSPNTALR